VSLTDPVVYLAIVGTLLLVGLLACVVPARSAMRTDPVETLRA